MPFINNSTGISPAVSSADLADLMEKRATAIQNSAAKILKSKDPAYVAAKAEYAAKRDKLQKTTQDFEAVFVGMMLKQMRKSMASKDALFGNSSESKMYQDMMDDATAQHMSKVGTFGLAKMLYKTMSASLPPDPDKTPDIKPDKEIGTKDIGTKEIDTKEIGIKSVSGILDGAKP